MIKLIQKNRSPRPAEQLGKGLIPPFHTLFRIHAVQGFPKIGLKALHCSFLTDKEHAMRKKYTKYFIVFYMIAYFMMMPPFFDIANQSESIYGLPKFIVWIVLWILLITFALMAQYFLDTRYNHNRNKDGTNENLNHK